MEGLVLNPSQPDKILKISNQFNSESKTELSQCLRANFNVFAWCHDDMKGLNPDVMVHKLNSDHAFKHVRQKKRIFAIERNQAAKEEVHKLL